MLNSSIVMTPRTRGLPVARVSLPVLPVLAMAVGVLPLLAPSQAQAATYHGDYEFWLPGNPRTTITSVTKFATNVQGA